MECDVNPPGVIALALSITAFVGSIIGDKCNLLPAGGWFVLLFAAILLFMLAGLRGWLVQLKRSESGQQGPSGTYTGS